MSALLPSGNMSRFTSILALTIFFCLCVFPSATEIHAQEQTSPENVGVTLSFDDFTFDFERIWALPSVNDFMPKRDTFIVAEVVISWNGSGKVCFHDTSFQPLIEGERIVPDAEAIAKVRDAHYPELEVPGTGFILDGYGNICVDDHSTAPTILVFDVPADFSVLDLAFYPKDNISSRAIFWLEKQSNDDYAFGLQQQFASAEDELPVTPEATPEIEAFEIGEIIVTNTELQDTISVDTVNLPNCNGSSTLTVRRTFSKESERRVVVDTRAFGEINAGGTIIALLNLDVHGELSREYRVEEGDTVQESMEVEMSAEPGTTVTYEIEWLEISTAGVIEVKQGNNTYFVEFTVVDSLRANIHQPVQIPCDS